MVEIKHATDTTFEDLVLKSDRPVIVDFWAVDVVKVDVDANPGLSRKFNIMSIPTIAFFPGEGKQPMGVVGFQPADQLEQRFGLPTYAKPAS
jgi:thioredoxin 1